MVFLFLHILVKRYPKFPYPHFTDEEAKLRGWLANENKTDVRSTDVGHNSPITKWSYRHEMLFSF